MFLVLSAPARSVKQAPSKHSVGHTWLGSVIESEAAAHPRRCLMEVVTSPLPCGFPPAEISLVQLDSMSLSHQMLVRCAAITGLTFTTELLFEILPCWNMKMMIKALATLVETKIFDCFRNGKELRTALKQNSSSFEVNYRSQSLKPKEGQGECSLGGSPVSSQGEARGEPRAPFCPRPAERPPSLQPAGRTRSFESWRARSSSVTSSGSAGR